MRFRETSVIGNNFKLDYVDMTVYDEKRKVLKELFEKHIRVKCKAKERSGALNIFTIDDEGNVERVNEFRGVKFFQKPGLTNTFVLTRKTYIRMRKLFITIVIISATYQSLNI